MNAGPRLDELLARRILVLDGAMGTMIRRRESTEAAVRGERFRTHHLAVKNDHDLLVLTRPDIVTGLHHAYLEAGADIVQTNTFCSTSIVQDDYGLGSLAYELNVEGGRLARAAADEWSRRTPDRPRFVAGTIGPTNKLLASPDARSLPRVTFEHARDAYRDQVRGLMDGGVDLLIVETLFEPLSAQAAITGLLEELDARGVELPVMISATVTSRGGLRVCGQSIEAFCASVRHARPFSVGLNCSFGARGMRPLLTALSRIVATYVSCHPNAGLPNALGGYEEGPPDMAEELGELAADGLLNIVGGCCGTTPAHIHAVADAVRDLRPRAVAASLPVKAQ